MRMEKERSSCRIHVSHEDKTRRIALLPHYVVRNVTREKDTRERKGSEFPILEEKKNQSGAKRPPWP